MCRSCSCTILWILFFITLGLILVMDFYYCGHLPEYFVRVQEIPFLLLLAARIFIGYVMLGCLFFLMLVKCKASSKCWGCIKCLWLTVHFFLGIGAVIYIYVKYVTSCGGFMQSFDECRINLGPVLSDCYTSALFFSLATLLIGLLPFVVFSVAYKQFKKERMEKLLEEPSRQRPKKEQERRAASATASKTTPEGGNSIKEILPPRNMKAEMNSKLMETENELGRRKYGNRFVSDINAPIHPV